jgi:hypothetical protein
MENTDCYLSDCQRYSKELRNDYRRLYQSREDGASNQAIREQKAKIKADKSRLKNVLHMGR